MVKSRPRFLKTPIFYIGIEVDETNFKIASKRVSEALKAREK